MTISESCLNYILCNIEDNVPISTSLKWLGIGSSHFYRSLTLRQRIILDEHRIAFSSCSEISEFMHLHKFGLNKTQLINLLNEDIKLK